ncbi:dienelactone hydrolase family protein [Actinacidiphila acidipaludis]|uniref:Dienelactone hydrolase family protein n=1 Tax=Actinacidiphila acidipaludis TaxID=2873382 RepID=A0ABS7Q8D0_9ACTN|nr:dienelactone hydrolase family protein [Streptomyces acidipaludis]MBY8879414.1 dienelactone hydrolase family protein [Streptomyces acidipaludis]
MDTTSSPLPVSPCPVRYPVSSTTVAVPAGDGTMAAYVAEPSGPGAPGRRPAVIVGFEMFGLTPYVRRLADRFAGLGHLAIVPDFYHRTAPGHSGTADEEGRARGYALLGQLDRDEVRQDLTATLAYLDRRNHTTGRTAMVGFSLGGHLAFFAATQVPLAAVAMVYPGWLDVAGTALSAPGPLLDLAPGAAEHGGRLLYLVGADDHVVTAGQTRLTAAALTAAGVRHEIVVYPDTPHGFLADERDTYRPDQAADAWRRIDALLCAELRSGDLPPTAVHDPLGARNPG